MTDTKTVEKKDVAIDKEELTAKALEEMTKILDRAVPPDIQKWQDSYVANMEAQYIEHPDEIAVLEFSVSGLETADGWPGWYDVSRVEWTKEGLRKYDRYKVVPRLVPTATQRMWEYTIVTKKEYKETTGLDPDADSGGLPQGAMLGALMRRANTGE